MADAKTGAHDRRPTPGRGQARTRRILARIRAIPRGSVETYGGIDPVAPRLVGRVLAKTDADVPWHRVVRVDGSVAKGERQLALLRSEGVPLRGNRVDFRRLRDAAART